MSVITQERPETSSYDTDSVSLNQWVNRNRPNVLNAAKLLPVDDSTSPGVAENDLASATQMLSIDRDNLVINIMYSLGQRDNLPPDVDNYLQAALAGYPLNRATQFSPNIDYHNRLNVYGVVVGQLIQKSLENFDETSNDTDNQDKAKLYRQLGTAVWVMTNEVTLRQKVYREILGENQQIDTRLQHSAFHDPSILLDVGQPELERIAEYHGKPAEWLANWADALTVRQVNAERDMLDQVLSTSFTDKAEHKKTRLWPQLIGFLALARA